MPQQRMDIRMIKNILRLKYQGALSHEAIARSLCISKGVVVKYLGLAAAAGLDWQATSELDEAALERRLLGRSAAETRVALADFARVHIELRRKGVTLMLLWQEYRAAHEGRRSWAYTQFCEHYKAFAKTLKRSMRQHRRAGEKLFIDYAGPTSIPTCRSDLQQRSATSRWPRAREGPSALRRQSRLDAVPKPPPHHRIEADFTGVNR